MDEKKPVTDVKPTPAESEHIGIRVVSQDGSEVLFKIKKSTQLKKLMTTYCSRSGLDPNGIRFIYDGQRVRDEQTPLQLRMQDNDVIDAVLEQLGGSY
eukprot:TRINITY_DN2722_c0_g1_i1.p1 TRINITY_DN2722_c0_g1~~TRINITY_DN2722_c0_g1_i1.p1  ORF type:complete len:112 (+),score=18.53 TRINITY_DN2722_c0_g1_i1:44-337(+)